MSSYEQKRQKLCDWVRKLRENPDGVLSVPHALFRAEDLRAQFDPENVENISMMMLGRELARQLFIKAGGGMPCPTKTHGQVRLWVVRELTEKQYGAQVDAAKLYDEERMS